MVAEVQRLQGLEASMEVRMDDMSRLSLFTPNRSSQNFESSCDKPNRWPGGWKGHDEHDVQKSDEAYSNLAYSIR